MGSDSNIACKTCKVEYYLGYGGGRTKEYRIARFPAKDHEGHDVTEHYSTDYLRINKETGDLMTDNLGWADDSVFIEGYKDYKFITFEPSPKAMERNQDLINKIDLFYHDDYLLDYRILQGDPSLNQSWKDKYPELFGKWRNNET